MLSMKIVWNTRRALLDRGWYFCGRIVFDILLIVGTTISAWFISSSIELRIDLVGLALYFSIATVIFFHSEKNPTEQYSGWIFMLIFSLIFTIIMMGIDDGKFWWRLFLSLITGHTEEAGRLWLMIHGGFFVFIALTCLYASIAGLIRHTVLSALYRYFVDSGRCVTTLKNRTRQK